MSSVAIEAASSLPPVRFLRGLEFVGKERVLNGDSGRMTKGAIISRVRDAEWQIWRGACVRRMKIFRGNVINNYYITNSIIWIYNNMSAGNRIYLNSAE